jgi:hypothetical protein
VGFETTILESLRRLRIRPRGHWNGVIVIVIVVVVIIIITTTKATGTMSIIQTIPERFTWKALHQGTTENSLAGHFIHTWYSTDVKVRNISYREYYCMYHKL